MSATALLMDTMEKLVALHRSLYEVTKRKTEVIKAGDMDALQQVMKDEQAHLMGIQKMEETRQRASKQIAAHLLQPTVTDCANQLDAVNKQKLLELAAALKETIMIVKETNAFNQQMLRQSMQFVNLSLNLLKPSTQSVNYGKSTNGSSVKTGNIGTQANSLLNIKA